MLVGCTTDRTLPTFPTPTPTPPGVEFGRAEAFWNSSVEPAVIDAIKAMPAIVSRCTGKLTTPCHDAIVVADQKLQVAITLIDNGDIPACLATDMRRFKGDVEAIDAGLQIALNGFKAGDRLQVGQGLSQFRESLVPLSPDATAVTNDVKVLCN